MNKINNEIKDDNAKLILNTIVTKFIDKNIKNIGGHSLLDWSIKSSLKAQSISQVYLSTDSEDYANIGKECGALVPLLRPIELASDTANDLDVIKMVDMVL